MAWRWLSIVASSMTSARSPWSGVAAMVSATGLFIISDTMMKLVAHELQTFQVLFMRGLFGFISCLGLVAVSGQLADLRGALHWRSIVRAVCETSGTFFYMVALSNMPIADAIAIGQTAPLLVIIALCVIFRERIGPLRLILVCTGFLGAVLVAQPDGSGLSPAAIFAFLTAMTVATRDLVARGVPTTIPPFVVTLMTTVILTLATGYATVTNEIWIAPQAWQWLTMAGSGFIVTIGQIAIFMSYRRAPASLVAPYYYSFTLWAVAAGYIVWREVPNTLALAGMALIVVSGLALLFIRAKRIEEAVA
jgi:drug/metabolite transporter (DMT)-like permease